MIQLRLRLWDSDDWTGVDLEGPEAEQAASVLSTWAIRHDGDVERLSETGEWLDLEEDDSGA